MPITHIYIWSAFSEGGTALKEAMGIRKIRSENSQFRGRPSKTVLNWGSSSLPPEVALCNIINRPEQVARTSNKLSFFQMMGENNDITPPWTTDFDEACSWITERENVVARTVLNSSGGNGIVIMDRDDPTTLVRARLYTKYIKKSEEYRIHVVRNHVVDTQRKVIRREKAESGEPINWKIRNLENGFVYQRDNIFPNEDVLRVAREALTLSGLDFGAVDVIWNSHYRRAYVLEINSAPGLQGTTVTNYADALRRL